MTPAARERAIVRVPILLLTAAAWIVLILMAASASPDHRHHAVSIVSVSTVMNGTLMFVAMMAPLLIAPIRHVRERSLVHRRTRAIAIFVSGYAAIWIAASVPLLVMATSLPIAWIVMFAIAWQCSPIKQRCLNRGHAHPAIAAFGRAANFDSLRFGLTHGVWCVGSCWALMLLPQMISRGHLLAMAGVTVWLIAERLEIPASPRWQLRLPQQLPRIIRMMMWREVTRCAHVFNFSGWRQHWYR